jgi:hypothetical protein
MGVDVARLGVDISVALTVDALDSGFILDDIWDFTKIKTTELTGWIVELQRKKNCEKIIIDSTGIGAGVYDMCKEQGLPVIEFHYGGSPHDKEKFANAKAEMYWNLRTIFERKELILTKHPKLPKLVSDLTGIKYEYNSKGKMLIIDPPKSPDYADALAEACYAPYLASKKTTGGYVAW